MFDILDSTSLNQCLCCPFSKDRDIIDIYSSSVATWLLVTMTTHSELLTFTLLFK